MAATAAAIIGATAALAGAGSSIYGVATRDNSQARRQNEIAAQGLQESINNEAYQKMLSTLINQRSIAGSTDQYGTTLRYDPATNQWVSALGEQPKAVQDASDFAAISRNTTDLRQAQAANLAAMERAGAAGPAADTAIRNLQSFRPMRSDELTGLLTQQATRASDATFRPLVADTLRSFQRTGTAAGPVIADIGKQQYTALRDSLIDAQLKGLTGVDSINQGRRQGLEQSAANAYTLATPQFQYPGISTSSNKDTLANLVATRAQQGGIGPVYGATGVNTANTSLQGALKNLQGSVPGPLRTTEDIGNILSSNLGRKDLVDNLTKAYNGVFGSSGTNYDAAKGDLLSQQLQQYTGAQNQDYFKNYSTTTGDTWGN